MRAINLIVLHCSATRSIREYTPEQLERDHRARGFSRAGYNYYVRRSGLTVAMRPLEMIPAHAAGYNRNSIGICYEGGLNGDSVPADTRTPEQKEAILRLLQELLRRFPRCRICGHRDLAVRACPCFDAGKEYAAL
jgi:N-acetylmuramoyl-L-alanine amidase